MKASGTVLNSDHKRDMMSAHPKAAEDCRTPRRFAPVPDGGTRDSFWTAPVLWRFSRPAGRMLGASSTAFTLLELLVVIVIIGILASIGLPAMKGIGQANLTAAANRQILDDFAFARLRAINERSTVYVVFVPPNIFQKLDLERNNLQELRYLTNLVSGQFTSYALLSARTVGDQPGQATPRYLTDWKTLPEGMLIPPYKFDSKLSLHPNAYGRAFSTRLFPFPNSKSNPFPLPYIAFNSQGQLISQRDELLPLAKGSVFFPRDDRGNYVRGEADVQLTPPRSTTNDFQFVRINWLTGRARMELPEFK